MGIATSLAGITREIVRLRKHIARAEAEGRDTRIACHGLKSLQKRHQTLLQAQFVRELSLMDIQGMSCPGIP